MKDFKKELDKLGDYLWKQKIQPDDALKVLKKTYELSPSNYRTQWKMWRFTMYLWTRLDEKKKLGRLGPKINSIRAVVETPKYRRLWETWAKDNKKFNADKEVKNLNLLITDPRQFGFFKERNFYYEGTKKNIPQELIDEIR